MKTTYNIFVIGMLVILFIATFSHQESIEALEERMKPVFTITTDSEPITPIPGDIISKLEFVPAYKTLFEYTIGDTVTTIEALNDFTPIVRITKTLKIREVP